MQALVGTRQQLLDGLLVTVENGQWLLGEGLLGFLSIQNLFDGLTVGMVYVLLAAGLSVIFGVMHVINFAHGELFALGAYFAVGIAGPFGGATGFYVALFVAPLLVGAVGVAIERYTVQPLYDRNPLYHVLLTFGLVLVINDLIKVIWGTQPKTIDRPDLITGSFDLLGTTFSSYALFMLGFGSVITAGVWWLLTKTRYGLIIRAGAQDRRMVRNLGIRIDRYYSLVFGVGAALAAVAGIIIAGRSQVIPSMGFNIIIAAFVIVVLGGLGSFRGAVVGGLGVGVLQESLLRPYAPQLEGMVIFLLMIGVLIVRPRGLFGSEFEEEGGELLTGSSGGLLSPELRFKLGVATLGLLAVLPLTSGWLIPAFRVEFLMVRILYWGLFALALDFVMGYTGLVSLGHALFWGIGAYVSGTILFNLTESAFVAAGVAVLVGATVAWIVGYLSIRVHGVYFAMITLGFAELFHTSLTRIDGWVIGACQTVPGCNAENIADLQVTGGSEGLFGLAPYYGIGGFGVRLDEIGVFLGPITLTDRLLFYYIVLITLVVSFLITRQMLRSPFGAVLKGIRENEQRVRFLGFDPTVYKRRAFTISGTFATLAGVLFALDTGFVSPEAAEWLKSGELVVMVILGGMGTLFGPVIGAFSFFGLETLIQEGLLFAPLGWLLSLVGMEQLLPEFTDRWRLVLGTIFILFVIFLPQGIVSIPEKVASLSRQLRDRGETADAASPGGDD